MVRGEKRVGVEGILKREDQALGKESINTTKGRKKHDHNYHS